MGLGNFATWEMLVIWMFVLVFFGPRRMPEIARSLGKAMREFKKGVNEIQRELEVADRDTRQATRTTWQPPSSTTPKTAEEATGPVPEDLSIQPPPSHDYPAANDAVAGDAATEPVPVSTHRPPVTDVESESAIDGVYMGGPPGSDARPEMETPPEMEDLPETEDPAGADPGTGALEEPDEADDSQAYLFRGNAPD